MAREPGFTPEYMVSYGGTHFNFHSIAVECAPENFGSDDQVVFVRETWAISGTLVDIGQDGKQKNLKAVIDRAHEDLMTKELTFVVSIGDASKPLISHGYLNDFDGGPRPKSLKITEISGGIAAHIAWVVEICRPPDVANPYLAVGQDAPWHTYIMTVQVDDRELSTRTISGSVRRAKSCLAGDARWVERLSTHQPLKGFKRERKWNIVRGGMQIDYQLTDKEIYLSFPKPVTHGKATFQIGRKQASEGEAIVWKTLKRMTASYEAPKGVAKRRLAGMLLNLVASRFALVSQIQIVTSFSLSEDVFGGQMGVEIESECGETEKTVKSYFQDEMDKTLGKDVPGAGGEMQDAGPWGTANINPLLGVRPSGLGTGNPSTGGGGWTPAGPDPGTNDVNNSGLVGGAKGTKPTQRELEKAFGKFGTGSLKKGEVINNRGAPARVVYKSVKRVMKGGRKIARLDPMAEGAKPILQETAPADRTVDEVGMAVVIGEISAGFPPLSFPGIVMVQRVVATEAVQDAIGQWITRVSWFRRIAPLDGVTIE